MTNQAFGGRKKVEKADTKTNLLNDFIRVFGINVIFNGLSRVFTKILWGDLDKVCDLGLRNVRIRELLRRRRLKTHENEHGWLRDLIAQPP